MVSRMEEIGSAIQSLHFDDDDGCYTTYDFKHLLAEPEPGLMRMDGNDPEKDPSGSTPHVFVVAATVGCDCTSTVDEVGSFLLRNYPNEDSSLEGTDSCAVWEAGRATSAAPWYFDPITIVLHQGTSCCCCTSVKILK